MISLHGLRIHKYFLKYVFLKLDGRTQTVTFHLFARNFRELMLSTRETLHLPCKFQWAWHFLHSAITQICFFPKNRFSNVFIFHGAEWHFRYDQPRYKIFSSVRELPILHRVPICSNKLLFPKLIYGNETECTKVVHVAHYHHIAANHN